jgi:hypothetical protein
MTRMLPVALVSLVFSLPSTPSDRAPDDKPGVPLARSNPLAGLADDFCGQLGDPIPSSLSGANSFALCKVGEVIPDTGNWGRVTQYYIRCKPGTLRSEAKWVIWCNGDGTHCGCNRESMVANPSDSTCCAWKAGDHCTVPGDARPGRNGCDSW